MEQRPSGGGAVQENSERWLSGRKRHRAVDRQNGVAARFPACQLWRHPCRQSFGQNEMQHKLAAGMPRSLATKDGCLHGYRPTVNVMSEWVESLALAGLSLPPSSVKSEPML